MQPHKSISIEQLQLIKLEEKQNVEKKQTKWDDSERFRVTGEEHCLCEAIGSPVIFIPGHPRPAALRSTW